MQIGSLQDDAQPMGAPLSAAVSPRSAQAAIDLLSLIKPRVTLMVVLTALGGACLSPSSQGVARTAAMLLSLALLVGSANTLNCYLERDSDKFMARTRGRPLPSGRLSARTGLGFGLALAVIALPSLLVFSNRLTALLGAVSLVSYVCIYTPLKRRSPWALHVGAVPGALPPLMGFTASEGRIGVAGVALFGLLFLWQLPHFLSIAIFRKQEYARAGLRSLPVVAGDACARRHALITLAALVPMSVLPTWVHVAGPGYGLVAAASSLAWFGYALLGPRGMPASVWARRNFIASLVYLPALVLALVWDCLR